MLASTFLLAVVMPFGPDAYFTNLDTGIFLALGLSSVSVIGILIAGWASANKYSLIGGLRAAGQLIAYELPMVLAVVGVVIQAGTLNLQGIVAAQHEGEIFGWDGIGNPFILTQLVGLPGVPHRHAGRAGPDAVRHAGGRVRDRHRLHDRVLGHAVPALLHRRVRHRRACSPRSRPRCSSAAGPCPFVDLDDNVMNVVGPLVLFAKMMIVGFLIFWVRFTFPRFREDQLQAFAWKCPHPDLAGQHPGHDGPEGGVLMPRPTAKMPRASSRA